MGCTLCPLVLIGLTVSNIGCELVSCLFALVWKAKEAATEGENGVKWNILKVSSVQAILASNLEVVICTFGFKCPELGCTRVSPRLCLLFTAGVRSVWRSEDVYTMTHIRQTCTFFTVPGPTHLSISAKFANVGKCRSWSSAEANKAAFITHCLTLFLFQELHTWQPVWYVNQVCGLADHIHTGCCWWSSYFIFINSIAKHVMYYLHY